MVYDLNIWAVLASILPFWFLTNVSHELSHGIVVILFQGWNFKLWPFPVFVSFSGSEHFYVWQKPAWLFVSNRPDGYTMFFAMCEYIPTDVVEISDKDWSLCHIAPRISNLVISTICVIICAFPVGSVVESVLSVLVVCNLVDHLVGAMGIFYWERRDYTDIWRFQTTSGWSVFTVRGVSLLLLSVNLAIFLIPF